MIASSKHMGKNSGNIMNLSTSVENKKIRASLLYILRNAGDMEIMRLAKLLYLSDYLFVKTFGNHQGFLDGHLRFKHGPVPKGFYDVLRELYKTGDVTRDVYFIRLKKHHEVVSELNEEEIACIDKVLEEFKGHSLTEVKKAAYYTEPMVNIQKKEEHLNGLKMLNARMDFNLIKKHPLFDNDDLDISFMNDPEFQKTLV